MVEIRPATLADLPTLWAMLHEHPEAHLDDTAPTSCDAFLADVDAHWGRGERLWAIDANSFAGAIGYVPITPHVGMLHGVCVGRQFRGQGIADAALRQVLDTLKADGVRKVSASYFADNRHIRACLTRLGFVDEGFLQDQTTRHRVPVSMWLVAKLLKVQR